MKTLKFILFLVLANVAQAAVVTRYFSTTGAGAADGTSWANRAALFSGGNWSSVIKNFAFNGTDSLLCLIGPGTYSGITDSLTTGDFANPPTVTNSIVLHGGYESGETLLPLTPPAPYWTADMPPWDDSSLPVLTSSTNISFYTVAGSLGRLLKFVSSGATSNPVIGAVGTVDWCILENSAATTSTCFGGTIILNSVLRCTGSAYGSVSAHTTGFNVRLIGNPDATSGNRHGWASASASISMSRVVAVGNPGDGFNSTSTSTSMGYYFDRVMAINNSGTGFKFPATASQTVVQRLVNCWASGNATGIDAQSQTQVFLSGGRFRNTTNFSGMGTKTTSELVYVTSATDTDEFVNASGGDFRIKPSATIAPMGFGISVAKPTVAY